jgi:ureidoglycolate amidohydrolase
MQITHLAIFSSDPDPAVTRILFTREDIAARGFIKDLMHDAGLTVRCSRLTKIPSK